MNPEAQEVLKNLLSKDPDQLLPSEREFLRARRDYLTTEQKRIFAEVINETNANVEVESEVEVDKTPAERVAEVEAIPAEPVNEEVQATDQVEVEVEPETVNPDLQRQAEVEVQVEDDGSADPDYKAQN